MVVPKLKQSDGPPAKGNPSEAGKKSVQQRGHDRLYSRRGRGKRVVHEAENAIGKRARFSGVVRDWRACNVGSGHDARGRIRHAESYI